MTDQKPQGRELGRGLSALLGDDAVAKPQILLADQRGLSLPIEFLAPSPYQPRRIFNEDDITELTASIRERGVLQPILVRPNPTRPNH